jgi:hypothetical protein
MGLVLPRRRVCNVWGSGPYIAYHIQLRHIRIDESFTCQRYARVVAELCINSWWLFRAEAAIQRTVNSLPGVIIITLLLRAIFRPNSFASG